MNVDLHINKRKNGVCHYTLIIIALKLVWTPVIVYNYTPESGNSSYQAANILVLVSPLEDKNNLHTLCSVFLCMQSLYLTYCLVDSEVHFYNIHLLVHVDEGAIDLRLSFYVELRRTHGCMTLCNLSPTGTSTVIYIVVGLVVGLALLWTGTVVLGV